MAKQNDSVAAVLRKLPAVDTLLKEPDLENVTAELGRTVVVNSIRQAIEEVRELILAEAPADADEGAIQQKIIAKVRDSLNAISRPHYRKVVQFSRK